MKQLMLFACTLFCSYNVFSQDVPAKKKELTVAALREANGVKSILPDFDFDAVCNVESYVVVIVPKRDDAVQYNVKGSDFPNEVKQKFKTLEKGAIVNIMDIKSRCPQDVAARNIGSLNIFVK